MVNLRQKRAKLNTTKAKSFININEKFILIQKEIDEINHYYLTTVNDLVNVHFSQLIKHPKLQYRLMQIAGIGSEQFHPWIAPGKRKKSKTGNDKLVNFFVDLLKR